jgi:hypothetical protein
MTVSRRDFLKNTVTTIAVIWLPIKLIESQPKTQTIKESEMYHAIERKLLKVDELPAGAMSRYERDVAVKSYVIPGRHMTLEQAVILEKQS